MIEFIGIGFSMSTKTKSHVAKKTQAHKCLMCECNAEHGYRGLCRSHYFQFAYARSKQEGKRAKRLFELEQIKRGRLLESIRGKHSKANPFLES